MDYRMSPALQNARIPHRDFQELLEISPLLRFLHLILLIVGACGRVGEWSNDVSGHQVYDLNLTHEKEVWSENTFIKFTSAEFVHGWLRKLKIKHDINLTFE